MTDTVLVTGVSGFIAKYVTAALLKDGYAVRGTLRAMARAVSVPYSIAASRMSGSRFLQQTGESG